MKDHLELNKTLDAVEKEWAHIARLTFLFGLIVGIIIGSILHDWLYNHVH